MSSALTLADRKALIERAKLTLAGKSRSYVDDAKVFAQAFIDLEEHIEHLARELQSAEARLTSVMPSDDGSL